MHATQKLIHRKINRLPVCDCRPRRDVAQLQFDGDWWRAFRGMQPIFSHLFNESIKAGKQLIVRLQYLAVACWKHYL